MESADIDEIIDRFDIFDDWADKYRYIIDLGRKLPALPEEQKTETNRVEGCVSNVWLVETASSDPAALSFAADSDAHITRGLVALLLMLFNGKPRDAIIATEAQPVFQAIGLDGHLSPSRSNGLYAMVRDIKAMARNA